MALWHPPAVPSPRALEDWMGDLADHLKEPRRIAWQLLRARQRRANEPLSYRTRRPGSSSTRKLLLLTYDNTICRSQIYPFFYYASQIAERYDVTLHERPLEAFLADPPGREDAADIVVVQPWFDLGPEQIAQTVDAVRARCRPERLVYLDGYAPTDLRYASVVADKVDVYVKKHVFRDRSLYGKPTRGDTNLTDFYCRHFGIDRPEVLHEVPTGFLDKLVVGPSFLTADYLLGRFARGTLERSPRLYDLHARLGRKGAQWYEALRGEALRAVDELGRNTLSGFGVSRTKYLRELRQTRICWSPFGYGEVAWRDYEAAAFGSVLLKNDMSHCETSPDLFVAGETYAPVRWDFSDVRDVVERLLDDEAEQQRLTRNAFEVGARYVREAGFVDQIAPVFG